MTKQFYVSSFCWITDPFQPTTCDTQCQQCGRLIPNEYDSDKLLRVTALHNKDEQDDSCRLRNGLNNENGSCLTDKTIKNKLFNPCQCSCGAMYCTAVCHEKATQGFHAIMCVGPHDENHATYKFKVLALESGPHMYSTVTLAAQYYWWLRNSGDDDQKLLPEWRERVQQKGEEKYQIDKIFDTNQRQVIHKSFDIFIEIFQGIDCDKDRDDETNSLPTLEEWEALMIYAHCHKFYGATQSLLTSECQLRTKENDWDDEWTSFVMNLESTQNGIATKIELMDHPEDFFQPISWVALLDSQSLHGVTIRHSCIATHQLVAGVDGNMTQLTLQEIVFEKDNQVNNRIAESNGNHQGKPEITVSKIDDRFDLESRTGLLNDMGMKHGTAYQCMCKRCIFERDPVEEQANAEGTNLAISKEDLYRLLHLAKVQDRYDDAMDIAEALVRRDPTDFNVLFQRARIAGWQGNFSKREFLLKQAAAMATNQNLVDNADFAVIRTDINESDAYYRKTSESEDDNFKNDIVGAGQWQTPFSKDVGETEDLSVNDDADTDSGHDGSSEEVSPGVFAGENILDAQECKHIVSLIEKRTQGREWTTSRHYSIPTTDIPVYQIPELLPWFNTQLECIVFPAMMHQFDIPKTDRLRILDAFFVKYNGCASNNRLPLHNDQSDYSLTIAMNSLEEYEGGGTYFNFVDETVKTDIGGIISFAGHLLHAGETVTKGRRYIIVAFIYQESIDSAPIVGND